MSSQSLKEKTSGIRVSENEKNAIITRLERCQNNLAHLQQRLGSYIFEPRTYKLHEKLEELKLSLQLYSQRNNEVLNAIRTAQGQVVADYSQAKIQFQNFKELKESIEAYFKEVRK